MRRTRRWIQVAISVLAVMALAPGAALASHGGDSASGHVLDFTTEIAFSARSSNAGAGASGNARVTFTSSDPNWVLAGEVTCLRILAATETTPALATIGVRVTRNTAPAGTFQSVVQSMIIFAKDSGKFSGIPDGAFASLSTGPAPLDAACPMPFDPGPAEGDVTIHNTFP